MNLHRPTGEAGGEAGAAAAAAAASAFLVILVESMSLDSAMPTPRAALLFLIPA